jgi:hypothetical protein
MAGKEQICLFDAFCFTQGKHSEVGSRSAPRALLPAKGVAGRIQRQGQHYELPTAQLRGCACNIALECSLSPYL